jgi:hypothetical protein
MSYKETYKETYKDAYNEAYYYYNMIANVHGKIGQRGRHVWGFGVNRALAYTHTHTHTHTQDGNGEEGRCDDARIFWGKGKNDQKHSHTGQESDKKKKMQKKNEEK